MRDIHRVLHKLLLKDLVNVILKFKLSLKYLNSIKLRICIDLIQKILGRALTFGETQKFDFSNVLSSSFLSSGSTPSSEPKSSNF